MLRRIKKLGRRIMAKTGFGPRNPAERAMLLMESDTLESCRILTAESVRIRSSMNEGVASKKVYSAHAASVDQSVMHSLNEAAMMLFSVISKKPELKKDPEVIAFMNAFSHLKEEHG